MRNPGEDAIPPHEKGRDQIPGDRRVRMFPEVFASQLRAGRIPWADYLYPIFNTC